MKNLHLLLFYMMLSVLGMAQTANYALPYRTSSNMLQVRWVIPNVTSDSVVVRNATGWFGVSAFPTYHNMRFKPQYFPTSTDSVQGLSSALALKLNLSSFTWATLPDKPTTFAPSPHTHTSSQITDFDTRLAAYQTAIPASSISNWNTAFSWGNHAGLYRSITWVPTKSEIGLSNVDNTSDANKPISTATQTALNNKVTVGSITYPVNTVFGRTGTITATTGDYNTAQVTELDNLYFTTARVLATALTGMVTTNATSVTATDNILVAIGKLQAQITSLGFALNSTNIGLSRATLNSTYPNAAPRFMVFCPDITLGGAIYVKVTTGSTGRWQTISAPPTL